MHMLEKPITDARAWTRDTVNPQDCIISLGKAELEEISTMAEVIEAEPLPII